MNETENKHSVCAANCPLNRVVTVHEIGYNSHHFYRVASLDLRDTPPHLVKYQCPQERSFTMQSFREIGSFALPVFEFKEVKKRGFLGWLGECVLHWEKKDFVQGGWIRLDNGETIWVSETYDELKKIIEGEKKDE